MRNNGRCKKVLVFFVAVCIILGVFMFHILMKTWTGLFRQMALHTKLIHSPSKGVRNGLCSEQKTDIFFLKVPKCGSGTTMTIMFRYVLLHNLNALILREHRFGLKREMSDDMLPPKPRDENFNIFATHAAFRKNKDAFKKYLANGTTYVGIVREPFTMFLSAMSFFKVYNELRTFIGLDMVMDDEEILMNAVKHETVNNLLDRYSRNFMSQYFGFVNENVTKSHADLFIEDVLKTFDFILVTEYFDESLILLKRYLCWNMEDIVYQKAHVADESVQDTKRSIKNNRMILKWFNLRSTVDYLLYEKSKEVLLKKISREGQGFYEEVTTFRNITHYLNACCRAVLEKERQICNVSATNWNNEFTVDSKYCTLLLTGPKGMLKKTIDYQYQKKQL